MNEPSGTSAKLKTYDKPTTKTHEFQGEMKMKEEGHLQNQKDNNDTHNLEEVYLDLTGQTW